MSDNSYIETLHRVNSRICLKILIICKALSISPSLLLLTTQKMNAKIEFHSKTLKTIFIKCIFRNFPRKTAILSKQPFLTILINSLKINVYVSVIRLHERSKQYKEK